MIAGFGNDSDRTEIALYGLKIIFHSVAAGALAVCLVKVLFGEEKDLLS